MQTGQNNSLLFLRDTISGRHFLFLVDSGTEVSVLLATGLDRRTGQLGPSLLAANGSRIKTYGPRTLSLHFTSNTYTYQWTFTIADVSRPLLGADFLHSHSFLVDLKGLVDAVTYLSIPLVMFLSLCWELIFSAHTLS